MDQTHHFRRIAFIWLLSSVVLTPIVIFVLAPGIPPGNGTVQSAGQVSDNTVLFAMSTPVALAVLVYFGYALSVFRDRGTEPVLDGPPIDGNSRVQFWWLVVTTVVVLFLAAYGSIRLLQDGSGGGQGPNPIALPAGAATALPVQVIAQQWQFTYRYPTYGGFETSQLALPAHTTVRFNVTSLDVIHSFWAYQLGVKADANPGINNVAYVQTLAPMTFQVHCAELCGVWHGYMFDSGRVLSRSAFAAWVAQQRVANAPATSVLPPYARKYFPDPQRRS